VGVRGDIVSRERKDGLPRMESWSGWMSEDSWFVDHPGQDGGAIDLAARRYAARCNARARKAARVKP